MIASLTGKDGIRVARFRGENWIVAGESARITALEAALDALRRDLADLSVAVTNIQNEIDIINNRITINPVPLPFYAFGNWGVTDAIPTNGTIRNQGAWNLDTDHAFVNINFPDISAPTWKAH